MCPTSQTGPIFITKMGMYFRKLSTSNSRRPTCLFFFYLLPKLVPYIWALSITFGEEHNTSTKMVSMRVNDVQPLCGQMLNLISRPFIWLGVNPLFWFITLGFEGNSFELVAVLWWNTTHCLLRQMKIPLWWLFWPFPPNKNHCPYDQRVGNPGGAIKTYGVPWKRGSLG